MSLDCLPPLGVSEKKKSDMSSGIKYGTFPPFSLGHCCVSRCLIVVGTSCDDVGAV